MDREPIYVVYLWAMGKALPPYFADREPDQRALAAQPRITHMIVHKAYRESHDDEPRCLSRLARPQ